MTYKEHISVLYKECFEYLITSENLSYLDMTFGGGGHFFSFLKSKKLSKAIGLDQDIEAFNNGKEKIKNSKFSEFAEIIHTNYYDFLKNTDLKFDCMLADLGVSSHHFDSPERGFSFRFDAELDMRMNTTKGETAKDILNNYSEEDLADIFYIYGEERLSRKIAAKIIEFRKNKTLTRTKELEEICFVSYPKHLRHGKTHPATRVFQALRIYVNKELEVLENSIPLMINCLKPGGRLGLISFHSLEDRIVKHKFKEAYKNDQDNLKILTKRPIIAAEEEVRLNPRSRSAKLRVIEKIVL